ncbi:Transcriptional regulator, TetR family [Labilithrix luteola]|uniref:Transcriptional regulator, TetR family n=1 Tax=Labilithrix luteola TaxID=1391654 RepID=A0A0K1QE00_9BACT|nr:TetR/AcrR family transcriptional regulator [Labilithrix luteola]AKV03948.1 Transcriptional regulator, TetR family [Labilithrix luteola]
MDPRERILSTAVRLFFAQGYAQTGINQLIDESGLARRTFYHHFESKEALGAAYLDFAAGQWLANLGAAFDGRRTARSAVTSLFEVLESFALETRFRGCGLLNMAAEFADAGSEMRARVQRYKDAQRKLLREKFRDLGAAPTYADQVHLLLEGAIAGASAHLDVWPLRTARTAALALLPEEESRR